MSVSQASKGQAMLEKFRAAKAAEITALAAAQAAGALPAPYAGRRPSLAQALVKPDAIAVIAEYKRASPSKGVINLRLGPEDVASRYAAAGAAALSVLTEETYFQGELDFLARIRAALPDGPPLLRKDFILDPLQVTATAATPASALLLIARMLDLPLLRELLARTHALGLDAVVEIFDYEDLDKARAAHSRIIQVNNRDLDRLTTDLEVSARLIGARRTDEIWISASGVATAKDLARIRGLGFDAALVGTSLMAGDDPGRALAALLGDSAW
jgi:indole-3-glycerol phosphate synthase